jgi:3-deoxy-7-phosphoheptulonate synthase
MVVILEDGIRNGDANRIREEIMRRYPGIKDIKIVSGEEKLTLQIMGGSEREIVKSDIEGMTGVERYIPVLEPYKLASRKFHPEDTVIDVGGVKIGGEFVVMAGPCSVDLNTPAIAMYIRDAGAKILRGGAFKPRTSPYGWQGMGEEGLEILAEAGHRSGLPVVTEVLDTRDVELVSQYSDILQVGMRNMTNYRLLQELSKTDKSVLLKNDKSAKFDEWMLAAEYIMVGEENGNGEYSGGNPNVILCHRGNLSYDPTFRNTFDVNMVAYAKAESHLPVCGDPSHGTGKRNLVIPVGLAGVAAGADSLLVEAHYDPSLAKTDGAQTIDMDQLSYLVRKGEELYNSLRTPI